MQDSQAARSGRYRKACPVLEGVYHFSYAGNDDDVMHAINNIALVEFELFIREL
jgi:hypothetical protein